MGCMQKQSATSLYGVEVIAILVIYMSKSQNFIKEIQISVI